MIHFVAKWAQGKTANQEGWLQALYSLACKGKGNGSIVFYTFPQLIVNKVVERTGGGPVVSSLMAATNLPVVARGPYVLWRRQSSAPSRQRPRPETSPVRAPKVHDGLAAEAGQVGVRGECPEQSAAHPRSPDPE